MIIDYQDICKLEHLIIYLGVTAGRMSERQLRRGVNKNPDVILDKIYRGELLRRETLEFDSQEEEALYLQLNIECRQCETKASRDVVAKGVARCRELNLPITGLAWRCPPCFISLYQT